MRHLIDLLLLALAPALTVGSVYALWHWPLLWLGGALALYVATWVFYGHVMNLSYVGHLLETAASGPQQLPHGPRQLGMLLLLVGYLLDYLLNAAVFCLLLLRLPLELTVSEALNRYGLAPTWRGRVARYFAHVWINPLDHKSTAQGRQHIRTQPEAPP